MVLRHKYRPSPHLSRYAKHPKDYIRSPVGHDEQLDNIITYFSLVFNLFVHHFDTHRSSPRLIRSIARKAS